MGIPRNVATTSPLPALLTLFLKSHSLLQRLEVLSQPRLSFLVELKFYFSLPLYTNGLSTNLSTCFQSSWKLTTNATKTTLRYSLNGFRILAKIVVMRSKLSRGRRPPNHKLAVSASLQRNSFFLQKPLRNRNLL